MYYYSYYYYYYYYTFHPAIHSLSFFSLSLRTKKTFSATNLDFPLQQFCNYYYYFEAKLFQLPYSKVEFSVLQVQFYNNNNNNNNNNYLIIDGAIRG